MKKNIILFFVSILFVPESFASKRPGDPIKDLLSQLGDNSGANKRQKGDSRFPPIEFDG